MLVGVGGLRKEGRSGQLGVMVDWRAETVNWRFRTPELGVMAEGGGL